MPFEGEYEFDKFHLIFCFKGEDTPTSKGCRTCVLLVLLQLQAYLDLANRAVLLFHCKVHCYTVKYKLFFGVMTNNEAQQAEMVKVVCFVLLVCLLLLAYAVLMGTEEHQAETTTYIIIINRINRIKTKRT